MLLIIRHFGLRCNAYVKALAHINTCMHTHSHTHTYAHAHTFIRRSSRRGRLDQIRPKKVEKGEGEGGALKYKRVGVRGQETTLAATSHMCSLDMQ